MSESNTKPALPKHTSRFIHDLRNNIASVRAGANMLARAAVKPEVVESVAKGLHQQVQEMLALIDVFIGESGNEVSARATPTSGSGEPLTVLVADDNADAANTLATFLRLDGHRPIVTYDGAETLRVAAADPPQVMLLDIGMPTKNGYDLAREVRSQPWGADVRLIAVSGYFSTEDRERALQAGFDDLLSKPIDIQALQRLIHTAV
jgi:CheY-like chemotaxis protein